MGQQLNEVGPHIMDAFSHKPWIRAVIIIGIIYLVVGVVFAALANPSVSDHTRVMRLAAWVASAAVYAAHIGYERFRLGASTPVIALHAAMAVALGAFMLAVAAAVHSATVASHAPYWRYLLALALWPIVTSLPAFLVALVVGAVLGRLPRGA
jgi:hypothetical protein